MDGHIRAAAANTAAVIYFQTIGILAAGLERGQLLDIQRAAICNRLYKNFHPRVSERELKNLG